MLNPSLRKNTNNTIDSTFFPLSRPKKAWWNVWSWSSAAQSMPPDPSALNHCLLPTSLKSSFDVADMSALMTVQMDPEVWDYKEENASIGWKKRKREPGLRIRVISFKRAHFFLIFYNGFYRNKSWHTPSMECRKSVRLKLKLCHSPLMCASGLTVDFPFKGENENNLDAPHAFVKSERIQHCRSPPPEEIPFHLLSSLLLLLPPPPPS